MKLTTLCYLKHENRVLMLYRNKKKNDPNAGKWIGVGGKIEESETPLEACQREFLEETGLELIDPVLRGIVLFISDCYENEMMFLYTATSFKGIMKETDEGELAWIEENKIESLPMWEGDPIFLNELQKNTSFFNIKLIYEKEKLVHFFVN